LTALAKPAASANTTVIVTRRPVGGVPARRELAAVSGGSAHAVASRPHHLCDR
jgi:hypothetical protein